VKKRPPYNANAMIRGAIRRTFSRSPIVIEVRNEGRREVPKYNKDGSRSKKDAVQIHCEQCDQYVGSTKIAVDHIEPVISVSEGFVDWNTFVERIGFDNKDNLQRLCDTCHQSKTNAERFERALLRDKDSVAEMQKAVATGMADWGSIEKDLKKFNKKKLAAYPQDLCETILWLKSAVKDRKKA
jgi:hypothetical protein